VVFRRHLGSLMPCGRLVAEAILGGWALPVLQRYMVIDMAEWIIAILGVRGKLSFVLCKDVHPAISASELDDRHAR